MSVRLTRCLCSLGLAMVLTLSTAIVTQQSVFASSHVFANQADITTLILQQLPENLRKWVVRDTSSTLHLSSSTPISEQNTVITAIKEAQKSIHRSHSFGTSSSGASATLHPNLPCSSSWDDYNYGQATKGGLPQNTNLEIDDYFEQQGCVEGYDYYLMNGYANGYIYGANADLTLGTDIHLDGPAVTFNLPGGVGFNISGSNDATHSISVSNSSYVVFDYSNLNASIFSCFGLEQTDTLIARISNGDYQTQSQITLPPG